MKIIKIGTWNKQVFPIEIKHYTPTTELEKILHENYTYIFNEAVKYRELSEKQAERINELIDLIRKLDSPPPPPSLESPAD
jgi:hypothetical protein